MIKDIDLQVPLAKLVVMILSISINAFTRKNVKTTRHIYAITALPIKSNQEQE